MKCLNQVCLLNENCKCGSPIVCSGKGDCKSKDKVTDKSSYKHIFNYRVWWAETDKTKKSLNYINKKVYL